MGLCSFVLPTLFLFAFVFHHGRALSSFESEQFDFDDEEDVIAWLNEEDDNEANMAKPSQQGLIARGKHKRKACDFSVGRWVYDKSYPLYNPNCPYLNIAVTCQMNGRPDLDYQKWRWKPSGCSLPRFNALDFLGKMRKKRIMLVGDSIMRNQWESLVCLVQGVIPTGRKKVSYHGPAMAFHALDFGTSIEFCWAPLLVELRRDYQNKIVLHLDSIEANARHWIGVDVLVFGSAHWWTHPASMSSWDYFMEGNRVLRELNPIVAYQKGLTTWAKWVDLNLDPRKSRVVFRSMSPSHNRQNGWRCYKQREPLARFSHPHEAAQTLVAKGVLMRMRFPVYLQDITNLSALRRDGHPSVYRNQANSGRREEKHRRPHASSDCSHWCLPGVPDTWNEILGAVL